MKTELLWTCGAKRAGCNLSEPLFFRTKDELYRWFAKNHRRQDPQWIGFYKKATSRQLISTKDAADIAMSFGWSGVVIKRIDLWSFQIKFSRRKPGSAWSAQSVQKFKELKKKKLIRPSGQKAFDERGVEASVEAAKPLSSKQLKLFKSNSKAWEFFQAQAPGYRKYMIYWVTQAKRPETQEKRLNELIADSADGTKLKRILKAIEKTKPRYEDGKTPIEEARNLGFATGEDFRSVHIETVEQLKRVGWERAISKVCELYPHRLNLNFFYAVVGAVEDQDWKKLDPDLKSQAKELLQQLKHG